ncbi:MAG TPA: RHS repeat-associated core domain-containing protein [Pyrinomonadaceae bacterium]|nr:RHS repeat-associated core domain-containing protein [Pyrinomonadaceae bacterium]
MQTLNFTNLNDNSLRGARKKNRSFLIHSGIARFSIHLIFVVSLLFGLVSPSLAQESCDTDGDVTIAYKGIMCALIPYTITFNNEVVQGPGDGCVMISASTPKTYTKLKLNTHYKMKAEVAICVTTINFQVPPGYTLYIDGQESNQIFKSNAIRSAYSGDGEWDIVVRKSCECGSKKIGAAAGKRGSVVWQSSMGTLTDGRSAYALNVSEKTLSAAIYTPSVLAYSAPGLTSEVDVVNGGDGNLRQVKAPQGLADIVVVNASEYDVRYYSPANVLSKVNGIYGVTGQPFVTWKFKNPDTSSTTRLLIQKIENGTVVDQSEYQWEPITDAWTLRTGWNSGAGTYSRIDSSTVSRPATNLRTVINTVKDNNGQTASKTAKTYQTFPWGEELVQVVEDPEVSALTTSYDFYTDLADEGSYSQLKSIKRPDGSWEKYEYNDVDWTISRILRPWKDLSLDAATPENSRVTLYQYASHDGFQIFSYYKFVSAVQEQIAGPVVSNRTFTRWSADNGVPITVNGQPVVREEQRDYASASLSQVTTTTRYYKTATPLLANRIADVEYPDGCKDTYTYEKGDYVPNADPALSQFTPNANGLAERDTIVHGTITSPNGVAFKTTKEITVRDQRGNKVLEETYVYNGTDYERFEWTALTYDDRSQVLTARNHKGELTTSVWTGEQKTSEIASSGIETTYTYDSLNRIKTQTKKGIAAGGGFPAQNDIVTTYSYDAESQQTSEVVSAGGLSLSSSRAYDKARRVTKETDEAGLSTTYSYPNGGRTQIITNPGGATEVTDNYLDGQIKSVTGSAVVAQAFDYGVNADGTRFKQEFSGSAGLNSPRWTKTTNDWLDRAISIEKPSFTGTNLVQTSLYNTLGQLQKQTATAGATKLIADTLYEYDELGRQRRTGLDINGDGALTPASTDRLNESETVFEKAGSDWSNVISRKGYLVDNSDTPTVQVQRERLNNFPLNGVEQTISDITLTDVTNDNTRITVTIDRGAKKQTTVTDTPDSNLNALTITVNGLLQSETATTPESATTYAYDSLGRQTSITEPHRGPKTRAYSGTTGQLTSTNDGAGSTNFEYYDATSSNAGRLKSQTNAAGKKTYFSYNNRGQQVQTWGDATYPIEYVYDNYGQKTELHTFRGGQNWTAGTWPSSSTGVADVTKWIYQDSTGLLAQKQDAALKGPAYTYDELGRMKTRVRARGITSTYSYDSNTGELRTITYSDSTPAVSFTYDRGGRQANITDAAGSHTRTFNVAGGMQTEQIIGGLLDSVSVSVGYDSFLRRNSLQTSQGANTLTNQTYGYDSTSRLETITSGSQTVTYGYHPNSGLLTSTSFTGGTNIARTYDSLGRLQSIVTTPAADVAQSYSYSFNNLNQRTRMTREDGSYWSYIYNDRGELVSGKKYWSDNSIVWGAQTEYSFDNIGNRSTAKDGGNQLGGLRQSNYTTNSLNQYLQRTVPGAVDVAGTANSAATVTVNNQTTARKADYFYNELAVDNSAAPAYPQINVVGARNNFGAGGQDAVTQKGGRAFIPKTPELFTYDDDGNITLDGRWIYAWDGENRLISMEAVAAVPVEAKQKLEFAYDQMGRRIQKKVSVWNVSASSYQLQSTTKFVYDGWNLMAELDAGNVLVRSYSWGKDLSGSLTGAGGIGGLLRVTDSTGSYIPGYDGNGNVTSLTRLSDGTLAATYEYDPFGNPLKSVGDPNINPFRFSTKYTDSETNLVYYGYRYDSPILGRWLSRDPSEEQGGTNLYAYVENKPIDFTDSLGLYGNLHGTQQRRRVYEIERIGVIEGMIGYIFGSKEPPSKKLGIVSDVSRAKMEYWPEDTGTPPQGDPEGWRPGDDRGHIIGRQLGGSGAVDHLFSQNRNRNRSAYLRFENILRRGIDDPFQCYYALLQVELIYKDPANRFRPTDIHYVAIFKLPTRDFAFIGDFDNP